MKERFIKKLKIWLIIIITFLLIVGTVVIVKYNQDPQALMEELDALFARVTEMSNQLNGNNGVKENIELPEKESLEEAQRYYYFQQLNNTSKIIYVTIEKNIDKILEGEDNIPLPASLNDVAQKEGKEIVAEEFQNAWDAFVTDKSEYFYIDSSKVCLITKIITRGKSTDYQFFIGKGDNQTYFIDEFTSKQEVEKAEKEIEEKKKEILKNATGNNYQKILYIHDWIVNNTEYENKKMDNTSNIYGCLVNRKGYM